MIKCTPGHRSAIDQEKAQLLQRSLPSKEEHSQSEKLYKANREFVAQLTGLSSGATVQYRENDLDRLQLTGEQVQNQIATNLFQIGMYMAAKKYGVDMIPKRFVEELQRVKKLGYKLVIVSGVREDIISGMLQIANINIEFDYIFGQPSVLGVSNEENMSDLPGEVAFIIGDKLSDLEPAKLLGGKTIFVTWGHATGGEKEFADYSINKAEELKEIIQ